ncbi:MAG: hypothetical protein WBV69_00885 [Candidatus Sulfotelmatobacter sp.]
MKSRCPLWLTALSASLVLFVEERLNALGEIIAHQLERPYGGNLDQRRWRPNPPATPIPTAWRTFAKSRKR